MVIMLDKLNRFFYFSIVNLCKWDCVQKSLPCLEHRWPMPSIKDLLAWDVFEVTTLFGTQTCGFTDGSCLTIPPFLSID